MLTRRGFIKALSYLAPAALAGCIVRSPGKPPDKKLTDAAGAPGQVPMRTGKRTDLLIVDDLDDPGPTINHDPLLYWKNRYS